MSKIITAPQVNSVSPQAGVNGVSGQQVTINGNNFTGATQVQFGTYNAVSFQIAADGNSIYAVIPTTVPEDTGSVMVSVTTPGGTFTTPQSVFTFQDNYYISGILPDSGSVAGVSSPDFITITGKGFVNANQVLFNGIPAGSFKASGDTSITCTVPQAAKAGIANVVVSIAGMPAPGHTLQNNFSQYTYNTPKVTSVSPGTGTVSGSGSNQVVQISGNGFTNAKGVQFGAVPATSFHVLNDTTLMTSVPQGSKAGAVDVEVITALGVPTAANPPGDHYLYQAQAVTGVSPNNGPVQGSDNNQVVSISGIGFTGASQVLFKGIAVTVTVPPAGFAVKSDTEIITCVPALPPGADAATFDVQVSTPEGLTPVNSPADQYTYNAVPVITSLSPGSGADSGGMPVTISGSGFKGATGVRFGNTVVNIEQTPAPTDSQVTVLSPEGYGTVDVCVITPNGTSGYTGAGQFLYNTIPFSFNVPAQVAKMGFYASMFGVLLQNYTNSAGIVLQSGDNVILVQTASSFDYVNVVSVTSGQNIPPFIFVNSPLASDTLVVNIPNVQINAARIVFGVCQASSAWATIASVSDNQVLPQATITVNPSVVFRSQGLLNICTAAGITQVSYTGFSNNVFTGCSGGSGTLQTGSLLGVLATPVYNGSAITAPTPALQGNNIYDFFEFTYQPVAGILTMTINTSAIDQFGLPIKLNVSGRNVQPGNEVGVLLSRSNLIQQFSAFTKNTSYNELIYPSGSAQPVIRILSPADQLGNNPVQGLSALPGTTAGSLTNGTTYSYVVTAVINSKEAPAAALMAQAIPASGSVDLSWGLPAVGLPAGSTYNIYRGVPNGTQMTWYQIADQVSALSTTDTGASSLETQVSLPPFDALANYFDDVIEGLFSSENPINVAVTDGFNPANGLQYNLTGAATPSPAWLNKLTGTSGNPVIEFTCTSIANNINNITPLIPVGSLFFVFSPFFNTNTFNPSNPSPPAWGGTTLYYANEFPANMVFGANGVFADNAQQSAILYNAKAQPQGLQQNAYSVALGAIEDKLNAAILRGIASSMNSLNWANSPTNLVAVAGTTTVTGITGTFYYVVTTVNSLGESTPSAEVSYITNCTSIQLNWAPVSGASSYNIYRGSSPGGENVFVGNTSNTSYNDTLEAVQLPVTKPPVNDNVVVLGLTAAALNNGNGSLPAGTYYYMITVLNYLGESAASASNEVRIGVASEQNAVTLTWNAMTNVSAYKIYRGTLAGGENILAGIVQGQGVETCSFTDGNNATQTPPPNIYYAPGTVSDTYARFFHQTAVSAGGLAYADPFDDQGDQSSTLTAASPYSVSVTIGDC